MKNIIKALNQSIWGQSLLDFYFSCQGYFNRLQFCGALLSINILLNIGTKEGNIFLMIPSALIVFYATLAAIQKRSRDIGLKGTVFILIYSFAFPITRTCLYAEQQHIELPYKPLAFFAVLYIPVCLFLLFMPGKKEKNPDISSPLLKRPVVYLIICFMLYIASLYIFSAWYI